MLHIPCVYMDELLKEVKERMLEGETGTATERQKRLNYIAKTH